MPSTIGKCKLFRIEHIMRLEGETFLRNKHEIAFFEIKCTFFGRKENTIRLFARNLLRGNRRRNTFRISFWCLAWDSNPGFSSNKPTHYLLDHGDFIGELKAKTQANELAKRWTFTFTLLMRVWGEALYWPIK